MTITVVQSKVIASASSGSFTANVTRGNTVFLVIGAFNSTGNVISSSAPTFNGAGVTGQLLAGRSQASGANGSYCGIWMLPNLAGGAASVGVTLTNGSVNANTGIIIYEVSGLGPTPCADVTSIGSGTSSTVSSGATANTTLLPDFVLGGYFANATNMNNPPGLPWNSQSLGTHKLVAAGYQTPAVSGSYTFSSTVQAGGLAWAAATVAVAAPDASVPTEAAPPMIPPQQWGALLGVAAYRLAALPAQVSVLPPFTYPANMVPGRAVPGFATPGDPVPLPPGQSDEPDLSAVAPPMIPAPLWEALLAEAAYRLHAPPSPAHAASAALTVTPSFSATARRQANSGTLPQVAPPMIPAPLWEALLAVAEYRQDATPLRTHTASAALTVTPSFSAIRQHGRTRTAALTVTPSFSAHRLAAHAAAALLTVTPGTASTLNHAQAQAPVVPAAPATVQGGWWQLYSIIEYAKQEREFYATRPPMACPRCGEPMRPAPPSDSGSEVELYCLFDGFQYPRDWVRPAT